MENLFYLCLVVLLNSAGFLFLLYKWNLRPVKWEKWCDFCFLFWTNIVQMFFSALYFDLPVEVELLAFPMVVLSYYIFLRIYHGSKPTSRNT